jgi:ABC-type multidrug transport system fused ATPase/permease subunit
VQWTIRNYGEINSQISSVGQLVYYSSVEGEAPANVPETQPPPSWPDSGKIEFKNVVLRYTKFGIDVLKNVNFTIKPSEKVPAFL